MGIVRSLWGLQKIHERVVAEDIKPARCDHCGTEFYVTLKRETQVSGNALLGGISGASVGAAQDRVSRQLDQDLPEVDCPTCGKYSTRKAGRLKRNKIAVRFLVWCCALPLLGLIAFAIEMASIEVRDEHRIENWVSAHQVVLIVGWGLPALLITCAPLLCDYNSEARCRRRLGRPRPGVWTKDEFRKRTGADRQPAIRLSQHRCEHCSGIVYFTDQERGGPVACQRCGRLCEIPALSEGA